MNDRQPFSLLSAICRCACLAVLVDTAAAAQYSIVHSFGNPPGSYPQAALTLRGSSLYGTSLDSGPTGAGAVFSMDTDGSHFTVLHQFAGGATDGSSPASGVLLFNSQIFGTTTTGGANNAGTLFSMNLDGSGYQVLHSFGGADGSSPWSDLTLIGSQLYGTTRFGGAANEGTVYSVGTTGTFFSVLHTFSGGTFDGANPLGGVTLSGGNLVGTTNFGGGVGAGTLYSMSTTGTGFHLVHTFMGGPADGTMPIGQLTQVGSTYYGVTQGGGANATGGSLFAIATNGTNFHLLHSFGGSGDGLLPSGTLALLNGVLYGATRSGGVGPFNGYGTVYAINPNGSGYQQLHLFRGDFGDGYDPESGVTPVGQAIFGTTFTGGGQNLNGTIFAIGVPEPESMLLFAIGGCVTICWGRPKPIAARARRAAEAPPPSRGLPAGACGTARLGINRAIRDIYGMTD